MDIASLKKEIVIMLQDNVEAPHDSNYQVIRDDEKAGKLYEAYVLASLCSSLKSQEGLRLVLSVGEKVCLKRGTGPINRGYPCIEAYRDEELVAEIWTDVCFISQSYLNTSEYHRSTTPRYGDYHELDILMVDPNLNSYPLPKQIWLGVECKNTGMRKGILKEILGVRREMSFINEPIKTRFKKWPQTVARSNPPCCLLLYSSDEAIEKYESSGNFYDIKFVHQEME